MVICGMEQQSYYTQILKELKMDLVLGGLNHWICNGMPNN